MTDIPKVIRETFYRVYYREIFPDGAKGAWHIHTDRIRTLDFAREQKLDVEKFGYANHEHCEAVIFSCTINCRAIANQGDAK